jgi:hypothetical protein
LLVFILVSLLPHSWFRLLRRPSGIFSKFIRIKAWRRLSLLTRWIWRDIAFMFLLRNYNL